MNIRSDMAIELINGETKIQNGAQIKTGKVVIDEELSQRINKPKGIYITLETGIVSRGFINKYKALSKAISLAIRQLLPCIESVLVVGLGNPDLTADSLGNRVFNNLMITRHISQIETKTSVSALCPNVMGATGIESFDIIKGVVDRIKPQAVLVVDSLASAAVGRIASAFQLSSAGITPGSGVANHRIRLDKDSLGIQVISIGVPLVVYASTIISEAINKTDITQLSQEIKDLIVTPKDIDLLVEECAKVIADGINKTFVI